MPRKSRLVVSLASVVAAILSGCAASTPAPPSHPLVGKWTWTRSENACNEIYDFRADGTARITSGDERTDNTYTVSKDPSDARGFYKLTLKISKDHGGKDCAELDRDDTGQENIGYVMFDEGKKQMIWCRKPNMETCFGPLRLIETM